MVKVKSKFVPVQTIKVCGEMVYISTNSWSRHFMEATGHIHPPPLYPKGKIPRNPVEWFAA